MDRHFVTEAVMLAIYGQLLVPRRPVEYILPYSTVLELYDLTASKDPIMNQAEEDYYVKQKIKELIQFFEEPFNRKKIERALTVPWKKSPTLLVNEHVSLVVVNAIENAEYGEHFDPIETDLILTAIRSQSPILTDQIPFVERVIEAEIPVQLFDIDDFEFALEEDSIHQL